ncbi:hypothetical protein [Microcystis sp. LE19-195.1E]|nr:hypothetical protein [Microcystis sp. LE19-195.1E]
MGFWGFRVLVQFPHFPPQRARSDHPTSPLPHFPTSPHPTTNFFSQP